MLALLIGLAMASDVEVYELPGRSGTDTASGNPCTSPRNDLEVEIGWNITSPQHYVIELRDMLVVLEGHHRLCEVRIDSATLTYDGETVWEIEPGLIGSDAIPADWYIHEEYELPDITGLTISSVGSTPLILTVRGSGINANNAIRATVGGDIWYGRDWDGDGYLSDVLPDCDTDCDEAVSELHGSCPCDCDDYDPLIHPGATEIPGDGIDQNCSGTELCFQNRDGDGFRTELTEESGPDDLTCEAEGLALASFPDGDCNDDDPTIYPGATEIPYDRIDQNCDASDLLDIDLDGFPGIEQSAWLALPDPSGLSWPSHLDPREDCVDTDPAINPGATEIPGDGIDQDCDDRELCFENKDGDPYRIDDTRLSELFDITCEGPELALAVVPTGDCNDLDPTVYPGAPEIPGDGIDQSCSGTEICYLNQDGDPFRIDETVESTEGDISCEADGLALASVPTGDCNDLDPTIYPGAPEIPGDGIDQSCSGTELCFQERDGDGFRTELTQESEPDDLTCEAEGLALASIPDGDCNDDDPTIYPGATEVPYDRIDQSCDESDLLDIDLDGFPGIEQSAWLALPDPSGLSWPSHLDPREDCVDTDPAINPGATEIPGDGIDQDCDDRELCFENKDGDPFRIDDTRLSELFDITCEGPELALALVPTGDCNDLDPTIYPGAPEIIGDGIDQSCSGTEICYVNQDGDPFRIDDTRESTEGDVTCEGEGLALAAMPSGDCNDLDPTIYPGAPEIPGDGIDQSCTGTETCYQNRDGDGFRTELTQESALGDLTCEADGLAMASIPDGDCNDDDPTIYPGAPVIVGDGVDQNCSGTETCYQDRDNDGWRTELIQESDLGDISCEGDGLALASAPTLDCNDDDPTVYPGATEIIADGVDQSCSDTEICYQDSDNDDWRTDLTQESDLGDHACEGDGLALAVVPEGDCDDSDPTVYPGAEEVWYDGIDQDCDGWSDFDPDRDGQIWPDYLDRHEDFMRDWGTSETASLAWSSTDCYDDLDAPLFDGQGEVDPADIPRERIWYNGIDDDCSALSVVVEHGEIVAGALINDFDQDGDGFVVRDRRDDFLAYVERYITFARAEHDPETVGPPPLGDNPYLDAFVATFGAEREDWEAWYEAHSGDCDDTDPDVFPGARGWSDDCDRIVEQDGSRPIPQDQDGAELGTGCACTSATGGSGGGLALLGLLGLASLRRRR